MMMTRLRLSAAMNQLRIRFHSDQNHQKKKQKVDETDSYDSEDDHEWNESDEGHYQNMLQEEWDTKHGIDSALFDRSNYIYKLQRNRAIHSSGGIELYFDVYVCDQLNVDQSIVNKLKNDLFEVADKNNDWRDGEPIQNIIDPDLYVYKHFDKQKWENKMKQKFEVAHRSYWYDDQSQSKHDQDWNQLMENEKKGYFIRSRYQWIATEFHENKEHNSISITS
eukprot:686039_1